ncbi:hypothetical protein BGC31_08035 [Komagataeibacter xylinus]|nr:hypothetical protein BGC31_08035 [Komagataeibacter xylinus]
MGQPIEERRRHLRVTKDVSPFTEVQIGCDDDTGALVEAAEQMEQQGAARRAEGEITEFIKDHEIQAEQPARLDFRLFDPFVQRMRRTVALSSSEEVARS